MRFLLPLSPRTVVVLVYPCSPPFRYVARALTGVCLDARVSPGARLPRSPPRRVARNDGTKVTCSRHRCWQQHPHLVIARSVATRQSRLASMGILRHSPCCALKNGAADIRVCRPLIHAKRILTPASTTPNHFLFSDRIGLSSNVAMLITVRSLDVKTTCILPSLV